MSNPQTPHGDRPPVLMTMGDPAGIGPEIVLMAVAAHPERWSDVVVVGDLAVLGAAAARLQQSHALRLPILRPWVGDGPWVRGTPGALYVIQAGRVAALPVLGAVSAEAGQLAAAAIEEAARRVLGGWGRAIVTAPIHKEALAAAGVGFPGHTEMLQALAADARGVDIAQMPVKMMLSCPGLRTVLVSIHVALRDAIAMVSPERVLETVLITDRCLRVDGGRRPRIAVAGLNPHAGEGGLFGDE